MQNEDDAYDFSPRQAEVFDAAIDQIKDDLGWLEFKEGWKYSLRDFDYSPLSEDQILFVWMAGQDAVKQVSGVMPKPPAEKPPEKIIEYTNEYNQYIDELAHWANAVVNAFQKVSPSIPKSLLDNIVIQDGVSGENFSGEDPVRLVNLAADAKSRKEWDRCIDLVSRSIKAFDESPLEYSYDYDICDLLRLPRYLHAAGRCQEAWALLAKFENGELPIEVRRTCTGTEALKQLAGELMETYAAIARLHRKDKNYRQELFYRCLSEAGLLMVFFFAEQLEIEEEGLDGEMRNEELEHCKSVVLSSVEKWCKRAKLQGIEKELEECILSSISLIPDVKGVYDYVAEKIRGLIFDAPFLA